VTLSHLIFIYLASFPYVIPSSISKGQWLGTAVRLDALPAAKSTASKHWQGKTQLPVVTHSIHQDSVNCAQQLTVMCLRCVTC